MENKETKTPEMEERKKLSYEQLAALADHLGREVENLSKKLRDMNAFNIFKRMDYLFKIVEMDGKFSKEFTDKCNKEIVDMMTLPDNEGTEEVKEK